MKLSVGLTQSSEAYKILKSSPIFDDCCSSRKLVFTKTFCYSLPKGNMTYKVVHSNCIIFLGATSSNIYLHGSFTTPPLPTSPPHLPFPPLLPTSPPHLPSPPPLPTSPPHLPSPPPLPTSPPHLRTTPPSFLCTSRFFTEGICRCFCLLDTLPNICVTKSTLCCFKTKYSCVNVFLCWGTNNPTHVWHLTTVLFCTVYKAAVSALSGSKKAWW